MTTKNIINDLSADLRSPGMAGYWLSAIIESADDAIISKTLEGVITSWNAGAQRIFGYTAEEVLGKPIIILIPEDHINEEPEILARLKAGERVKHYETIRKRKDGSLVDISLTVSPILDSSGKVIGASKIARDISERKRAEQALAEQAEIIETVNQLGQTLAGELELHKIVQAVTDAATNITEAKVGAFFYNVFDENGGSFILHAISGELREAFAHIPMTRITEIFAPTFKGEGTVLMGDVKQDPRYGKNSPFYGMANGQLPITSYMVVPVIARSGEVYGGLFFGHSDANMFSERVARIVEGLAGQAAVAMDNSRLYEAAQFAREEAEAAAARNERLYQKAEESSRLKEEFLATISHELRTPLNAILGWARMLRTGLKAEDTDKALETIERNARAQAQLIDDLLDVSRIVTGKLQQALQVVNDWIQRAVLGVRRTAKLDPRRALFCHLLFEFLHQAGFTNPWLSTEQHCLPFPFLRLLPPLL